MANSVSALILILFLWGRTLYRKNLRLHIITMIGVIIADLMLVLSLVLMRDALSKVGVGMPLALKVHVPIAIGTVMLYFPTAYTGYQLYIGKPVRQRMRTLDRTLVVGRVMTLVTSLWVQLNHWR